MDFVLTMISKEVTARLQHDSTKEMNPSLECLNKSVKLFFEVYLLEHCFVWFFSFKCYVEWFSPILKKKNIFQKLTNKPNVCQNQCCRAGPFLTDSKYFFLLAPAPALAPIKEKGLTILKICKQHSFFLSSKFPFIYKCFVFKKPFINVGTDEENVIEKLACFI